MAQQQQRLLPPNELSHRILLSTSDTRRRSSRSQTQDQGNNNNTKNNPFDWMHSPSNSMNLYRAANPWPPFEPDSNSMTRNGPELTSFLLDLMPQNTSIMADLFVVFPLYTTNLSKWLMQLQVSACKRVSQASVFSTMFLKQPTHAPLLNGISD